MLLIKTYLKIAFMCSLHVHVRRPTKTIRSLDAAFIWDNTCLGWVQRADRKQSEFLSLESSSKYIVIYYRSNKWKYQLFSDLILPYIYLFSQSSALIRMMQSFLGDETLRKGIEVGFAEGSLCNENFFLQTFSSNGKQRLSFLHAIQIYLRKHQFANAKDSDLWKAMSEVSVAEISNLLFLQKQ